MSHPETCRIAARPADYQHYGIARGEITVWEDGFRTRPGGPGTFEWDGPRPGLERGSSATA